MAQPIQSPGVGTALQRLFGLQGRVRPALEEFIIPTVMVGRIDQDSVPGVSGIAMAAFAQPAVAGEQGTWRLEVPGGSLAELLWMDIEVPAAEVIRMKFPGNAASIAALASTASKGFLDGRVLSGAPGGGVQPAGVLTYGTLAGNLGTPIARIYLEANVPRRVEFPPGTVIGTGHPSTYGFAEFQFASANTNVNACTLAWREYSVV